MDPTATIDGYIAEHLDASLQELAALCRIPSVHTRPQALQQAADWVAAALQRRGFRVQAFTFADAAPVVYAERQGRSPRTLLFYNHYDVQPPDPVDAWHSPPFELTRRGGKAYARGASDDKGHLLSRLLAIDALLHALGELPVTVKFVVEGDEEGGGSAGLHRMVARHPHLLQADGVIWEFGGVDAHDTPLQFLGTRGLAYVALEVQTLPHDMHSGIAGSLVPNAAWRLVWALHSLKGPDGRVLVEGFYDRVVPPSPRDLALLDALPDLPDGSFAELAPAMGLDPAGPVPLEVKRRAVFEPTANIAGLTAGYQGPGKKTVLPARARALLDFRLVPWQEPAEIPRLLRAHLDAHGFGDVQVVDLGGVPPMKMDPDHPFVNLVVAAAQEVYARPMRKVPLRGVTGPGHLFVHRLGLPVATSGLGYPGSNLHAPNENLREDLYALAARHAARIALRLAAG